MTDTFRKWLSDHQDQVIPFLPFLALETATRSCSVALCWFHKGRVSLQEWSERTGKNIHEMILSQLVEKVFIEANLEIEQLKLIAVSYGPGSFTGLRVGLSYAKGLATVTDLSIAPIPTLDSLFWSLFSFLSDSQRLKLPMSIIPAVGARRGEVWIKRFGVSDEPPIRSSREGFTEHWEFPELGCFISSEEKPLRCGRDHLIQMISEGSIIGGQGVEEVMIERNDIGPHFNDNGLGSGVFQYTSHQFNRITGEDEVKFPSASSVAEWGIINLATSRLKTAPPEEVLPYYGEDFIPSFQVGIFRG